MTDREIQERMRDDWDRRAREDAGYYVAFGRRRQSPQEFFASASEALHAIQYELRRFPPEAGLGSLAALEIGCGPGRLMLPLSRVFGHVAGVDVSPEMVELARKNLAEVPHARVAATSGSDLAAFAAGAFDFCYSYAVFQHIPSRDAVWSYLREAWRVLKPGGILKCQFNGLPETGPRDADTWNGSRFRPEELRAFCRDQDFQLLLLDGANTQNLWMAARKQPRGWAASLGPAPGARLLRITNTYTSDLVVPAAGRFASASLWLENLTEDADLNRLEVELAGRRVPPCYIGRYAWKGPTQVNVFLPSGTPTGLVRARLWMLGEPVSGFARLRVVPPPPSVPRLLSVTDGINLLSKSRIETRTVKVDVEEAGEAAPQLSADLDGEPLEGQELVCVDPVAERYAINASVPASVPAGPHLLTVWLRGRVLARTTVELAG